MDDDELLAQLRAALKRAEAEEAAAAARTARYVRAIAALSAGRDEESDEADGPRVAERAATQRRRDESRAKHPSAPVDLDQIARIARAAHAEGKAMRQAVAAELDIGAAYAGQLIRKARDAGQDIPYGPWSEATPWRLDARVADVAKDAIREGRSAAIAVSAEFDCNESAARNAISRARKRGHDIPYTRPDMTAGGERPTPKPVIAHRPGDPPAPPSAAWTPERAISAIEGGA